MHLRQCLEPTCTHTSCPQFIARTVWYSQSCPHTHIFESVCNSLCTQPPLCPSLWVTPQELVVSAAVMLIHNALLHYTVCTESIGNTDNTVSIVKTDCTVSIIFSSIRTGKSYVWVYFSLPWLFCTVGYAWRQQFKEPGCEVSFIIFWAFWDGGSCVDFPAWGEGSLWAVVTTLWNAFLWAIEQLVDRMHMQYVSMLSMEAL